MINEAPPKVPYPPKGEKRNETFVLFVRFVFKKIQNRNKKNKEK